MPPLELDHRLIRRAFHRGRRHPHLERVIAHG